MSIKADLLMPKPERRKTANHQVAAFNLFDWYQCCSAKAVNVGFAVVAIGTT
ncbi:hypothetical protein K4H28_01535 [Deefgea tanakiae]|uniref:Uncharacterized protein n=1 Tax=Deefgea tanakiae TaxID=2865840 RepID=A0ABX8ZAI5_9NEIS|nr:hypothetical protein [Deefgea tanakiae]QZA78143.1 hypothetical protein K4H28_01535 [Deefgea tanakiae]